MPGAVKDPIVDEDEQLKAQLDAIKRAEQPEPPVEAAAAEPIQEDPAQVVAKEAEAKAIADAAAAEEKPPVETKPDETRPPAGKAWQSLRAQQKKLEEREAELAAAKLELERRTTQPDKEPDFETQPADYLKGKIEKAEADTEAIRQELAHRQQQDNYRAYIDGIKQQEEVFEKDHPDYRKATEFLIDKDVKQWERAGLSVIHTNQVLEAARSNDPRYANYRTHIERLSNDPGVIFHAEKTNQDPEVVAAFVTARDNWLTQRRDLLAQGAKARGVSVAQSAYEEAVDRGWNSNGQTTQRETDARARVAQAKEVSAASRSLSDSGSAESAPEVRVLKNRNQVLDLDEATLDKLIESGQYRNL